MSNGIQSTLIIKYPLKNKKKNFVSKMDEQSIESPFVKDIFNEIQIVQKNIQSSINSNSTQNLSSLIENLDKIKQILISQDDVLKEEKDNLLFDISIERDDFKSQLNQITKKFEVASKELEKLKNVQNDFDLESELNEIKLEKEDLQVEIDNLRSENDELKQNLQKIHSAEIESEVSTEWREKFFKLQEEKRNLNNQIAQIQNENDEMKKGYNEIVQERLLIDSIKENLENMTKQNLNLQSDIDGLTKQIKALKNELNIKQLEIEEKEKSVKQFETKNQSLEHELQEAKIKLARLDEVEKQNILLTIANKEVITLKLQNAEMEKLLSNHEATIIENVEIKAENQKILKKSKAFQDKLKDSLQQTDTLIKTLSEYRSKMETITEIENENLELNDTIEKLQQELSEKDQVFESLQEKIQERLSKLINENKQLKEALHEQVELREEQTKQNEINQKRIEILSKMNSESFGQALIEKEAEIAKLTKEMTTLDTINRVAAEQIFQFQSAIEAITSKVTILSQENTNIRNECLLMKDELQDKENEIQELNSKIVMLESINNDDFIEDEEFEKLKKEKMELQSKVNLVELADIISLKSRIRTLTDQLEEQRMINQQLSSVTKDDGATTADVIVENEAIDHNFNTDNPDDNEVEIDEQFVDVEVVSTPIRVEKKKLEDIHSEFIRYLHDAGTIDQVLSVIINEVDENIRQILIEIKKPDKQEIQYLRDEIKASNERFDSMKLELESLREVNANQKKELDEIKSNSNLYQKHLDDLTHLLK